MLDGGKALRPTGGYVYDPVASGGTGGDVEAVGPVFGSSAAPVSCKIKPPRAVSERESEAGGRTVVTLPAELHLPADPARPEYASLRIGDYWEIVTVTPTSLTKVGRRYRITNEADGTSVTACRYTVERVVT